MDKGLANLPYLRALGQQLKRKVLEVERLSHHCVLTQDALDHLHGPTVEAGQQASALRFGDPRVMALLQAITALTHLPRGFRNRDLRPQWNALLPANDQLPRPLRAALNQLDAEIQKLYDDAALAA